jgi:sugar-phosphatase
LDQLKYKKPKWAIATSGTHTIAELRLISCALPIPEVFVTSELVKNGKPNAEPFLLAVTQLVVNPQDCLVFEDSDAGITSAIAAGCDVVVIGQTSTIQHKRIVARVDDYYSLTFSEKIMESV